MAAFSLGFTSANTWEMPTWEAIAFPVIQQSPVNSTVSNPQS